MIVTVMDEEDDTDTDTDNGTSAIPSASRLSFQVLVSLVVVPHRIEPHTSLPPSPLSISSSHQSQPTNPRADPSPSHRPCSAAFTYPIKVTDRARA